MKPITLYLSQPVANFVQVGVPLAKGEINDCDSLAVYRHDERIRSVISATALWPDQSVKWCMVKIALDSLAEQTDQLTLRLTPKTEQRTAIHEFTIQETEDTTIISSDTVEYRFPKNTNSVFPTVLNGSYTIWNSDSHQTLLSNSDGTNCELTIKQAGIERQDSLSCEYVVQGSFSDGASVNLNTTFRFEFLPKGQLRLHCDLHNPNRAMHPGGIWDLGDPGSVTFKDFTLSLGHSPESSARLRVTPESPWQEPPSNDKHAPLTLFQASSGGKNWDSPTHKNAKNKVCNKFCGYQLTNGSSTIDEGLRSTPTVTVHNSSDLGYSIQPKDFWQNFPKSIDISSIATNLRLFPYHHGDPYEIQGGERKTHSINFQFAMIEQINQSHSLTAIATLDPSVYTEAGIFPYFDDRAKHQPYENLLSASLDESHGFYAKREKIDEFGWRNFGEIYADHEAHLHTDDTIFVSHYNNQYDPIGGFAKQFALTGDLRWYELMSDLALHVMDIDIYRTEQDRVEYNHGLFWHTDHYTEAHTATHRTFSSKQITAHGTPSAGGGPGTQHCYSTGLVYYFYLTGSEEAKQTVFKLGEWIHNYYQGTGSILEIAKNTLTVDSKDFIQTCKGSKIFAYRYGMDRGTGNCIRTLMDCYELSRETRYLENVEKIIKDTAGPHDDINARKFDDPEATWHHIVFLQDLVRYLDLKRNLEQLDSAFHYARSTLLHYARWLTANEHPYLTRTDKLEYPNATWIAQETRKINVLYAAYRYALTNRTPLLEKAKFFRDYLTDALKQEETLHYSRIQILLLQNHGPAGFLDKESLPYEGLSDSEVDNTANCFYTPTSHIKQVFGNWLTGLSTFKLSNEIRWIKSRTGRTS